MEHLAVTKFSNHSELIGKWHHQADFGNVDDIEFLKNGTIKAGQRTGFWEQKGETLILKWPKGNESTDFWVDQVQLAYQNNYYVGRNAQGLVIRGYRASK